MLDINYGFLAIAIVLIIFALHGLWRGRIWTIGLYASRKKQFYQAYRTYDPIDFWETFAGHIFLSILFFLLAFKMLYLK